MMLRPPEPGVAMYYDGERVTDQEWMIAVEICKHEGVPLMSSDFHITPGFGAVIRAILTTKALKL